MKTTKIGVCPKCGSPEIEYNDDTLMRDCSNCFAEFVHYPEETYLRVKDLRAKLNEKHDDPSIILKYLYEEYGENVK